MRTRAQQWWKSSAPRRERLQHRADHYLDKSLETGTDSVQGVARFVLYALLGASVGLIVALIEWLSLELLLEHVIEAPLWVKLGAPAVGLTLSAVILRIGWRTNASTSDLYVKTYHGEFEIERRRVVPKLLAAMSTVGFGGTLGMEGPAIYTGTVLAQGFSRRRLSMLGVRSRRIMLVAGAAAGVAAVFRAPATGVLFAIESPFKRDIARNALIPALVASTASYLTFVAFLGTERLLFIRSSEEALTRELLGAVVLGLCAGITARFVARLFHWAKDTADSVAIKVRLPLAGIVLVLCVLATNALVHEPISLGPGTAATTAIVTDPTISVWVILALFGLRAIATSATLAGGGVGGVFIPLVVQGMLLGRIVEVIFDAPSNGLFPVVALAAVLGAGYRTPLAAVMFVAETTGRAEFVIPALLATAISQSLMGEVSVSTGQVDERKGQLEHRLSMPTGAVTVDMDYFAHPDDELLTVVDRLGDLPGDIVVPVSGERYCGLLVLSDIALIILEHGPEATVEAAMRDVPAVSADADAIEAADIFNHYNTAAVAVVNSQGIPIGVVTATSLAGLNDLPWTKN